jgi:hypothetical protein
MTSHRGSTLELLVICSAIPDSLLLMSAFIYTKVSIGVGLVHTFCSRTFDRGSIVYACAYETSVNATSCAHIGIHQPFGFGIVAFIKLHGCLHLCNKCFYLNSQF